MSSAPSSIFQASDIPSSSPFLDSIIPPSAFYPTPAPTPPPYPVNRYTPQNPNEIPILRFVIYLCCTIMILGFILYLSKYVDRSPIWFIDVSLDDDRRTSDIYTWIDSPFLRLFTSTHGFLSISHQWISFIVDGIQHPQHRLPVLRMERIMKRHKIRWI